jgi:hypothetical protein
MECGLVIWVAKTLGHRVQSIAHGIVQWMISDNKVEVCWGSIVHKPHLPPYI